MANEVIVSAASLAVIERTLKTINDNIHVVYQGIETVDAKINEVDGHVDSVEARVTRLAEEFGNYVRYQILTNNKAESQGKINELKPEIANKFGHHDKVRRQATGILQATDLGLVRAETIVNVTEEDMLSSPNYWLAPCLVALAAWINNQPELAAKAVAEAIHRDDEKTSLFFLLVCRRAGRTTSALKWTQRYFSIQDEENLDRNAIIILDAFASGLLGSDSEGIVSKQMGEWLERLSAKPGFIEQQISQWSDAIYLQRETYSGDGYTYLPKNSPTWPQLQDVMEGAELHASILSYFLDIFNQEASTASLKVQVDAVLDSLVTDFDNEEIPLRRELKYHEIVVECGGDRDEAQKRMDIEKTAFDTQKDFTQLLTDAAMKPESSHSSPSTQKFAIALSRDWISTAYKDVVAKNRQKVPHEIEINIANFKDKTTDGRNEQEMLNRYGAFVEAEKQKVLSTCTLSMFEKFALILGIILAVVAIVLFVMELPIPAVISLVAAVIFVVYHFSKRKTVNAKRKEIANAYEQKKKDGNQVILATLAEVVDFRAEFARKDAESQKVFAFLDQIAPEQYVRKLASSNRRINVNQ